MAQINHVERWDSDVFQSKEQSKIISADLKKNLQYMPHPFHGWRSVPNQNLETIHINEYGLRCKKFKQHDTKKRNCVLLGGSVAWGFGASSNQNIPSFLIEKYLNQNHNINLNVINFAEQMYSSFEEILTFVDIITEINPQIIICLSSYNDIIRSYINKYKFHDIYKKQLNFFLKGQKIGLLDDHNYLSSFLKFFLRGNTDFKNVTELNYNFKNIEKLEIINEFISKKFLIINSIASQKKINVYHFIQPSLFIKKNKSSYENKYLNWFEESRKAYIIKEINKLEILFRENEDKKVDYIHYKSLLNVFDHCENSIFFDSAHISDEGNLIMAKKVAEIINKSM